MYWKNENEAQRLLLDCFAISPLSSNVANLYRGNATPPAFPSVT